MDKNNIINKFKGGLIVSCQALEGEALHSSFIMGRMALAAKMGGAKGIRANSPEDIAEIKKNVDLPIIGIIKKDYPQSPVYITPTIKEVDILINTGIDIIAADATFRIRPDGIDVEQFIRTVKNKYPNVIFMADISTYEEGMFAQECGADLIATTLAGYTSYTAAKDEPDFELIERLVKDLRVPLIVEGRINTPEEAQRCIKMGAWAVVVGGAITRPELITKRFVDKLSKIECSCQVSF